MGAFDNMYNFFEKSFGNHGKPVFLDRPESRGYVDDGEVIRKDDAIEEAKKTKADQPSLEELIQSIQEREKEEHAQKSDDLEKADVATTREARRGPGRPRKEGGDRTASGLRPDRGDYPSSDKTWGAAYSIWGKNNPGKEGEYPPGQSPKKWGSPENQEIASIYRSLKRRDRKKKSKEVESSMDMELSKMSPALASLLSAAAGWALSADTASRDVPPDMAAEWERAISREDKRRLQEDMIRRLHGKSKRTRKSEDGVDVLEDLQMFYKDHAPVPPRYGLMWDAVKHRWTRPEKVGRTVWEVQGKKRLRGTGTGVHERSRTSKGSGGKGQGSMEAGRRFRSVADAGRTHPHEAKRVGQDKHKPKKPVGRK